MKPFKKFQIAAPGFTLMELLISITINITIISITGSAFKLVYNSVEEGEEKFQKECSTCDFFFKLLSLWGGFNTC